MLTTRRKVNNPDTQIPIDADLLKRTLAVMREMGWSTAASHEAETLDVMILANAAQGIYDDLNAAVNGAGE